MDTQGLQLNAPETQVTQQVRSKMVPLIAGAAVLIILAAIGVYYVAFRSLPTTLSWAPSVSAIAPGGDLTVSGRVTPAESGRLVSFESAPKAQGPWQPMPQSATTDSRGQFSITYKPQLTGSIVIRVTVDPAGRYLAVIGKSMPVRLLTPSSISLKGGGAITTETSLDFTVAVDPPGVGRTVRIEQSSDKVRWVPVGSSVRTETDGTSVVSVPGPAVGVWSYRATVVQDDKFAAAVSPIVSATVEDMTAAATTYLRIIDERNAVHFAFYKALDRASASTGVPTYLRTATSAYSAAETRAATKLSAYNAWPQSVRPLIDQMIAQAVIHADNLHGLAAVTDMASWSAVLAQGDAASAESGRLSTLIRQALGLPQRSTSWSLSTTAA
jgi:hypothetical protein